MSESVESAKFVESGRIVLQAPAKLNIHLGVLGRREDGYHEIQSLFHRIDLMDTILMEPTDGGTGCEICGNFPFPAHENIIHRTYTLFRDETGTLPGVRIRVEKRIPMGAGLGGGSSDAAAVLTGLNRLARAGLSCRELSEMGSRLGSDVPFFLADGAAWVTGRGEHVRLLRGREDLIVVLATPEFGIASKDAYAWIDADVTAGESRFGRPLEESGHSTPWEPFYGRSCDWAYTNTFLPSVIRRHPSIVTIMKRFRFAGADFVGLTGSGSTVFGLFEEPEKSREAVPILREIPGIRIWEGKLLARTT